MSGTDPLNELPWYCDHANLVILTEYMARDGATGDEVAEAVRKPWKYTDEFDLARLGAPGDDR